jgi:hypothetical protein
MSYDIKKGETKNPLKVGVKWGLIGTCYTPLDRYFQGIYDSVFAFSKKTWFEKNMSVQSFKTTKVPILGLPLGSFEEKWQLDVVPAKKHKVYYKEGSGASSQRLRVVWSLFLRLALLNWSHNFHLTCINCPLFLVMQVDIILNFHLWVCFSPILELQHTLLPLKCCELKSVPQLYPYFVVSLEDAPLGPSRSLGAHHHATHF